LCSIDLDCKVGLVSQRLGVIFAKGVHLLGQIVELVSNVGGLAALVVY
jgi:hypothetical protein